jgi:hypothetical protein
MQNKLVSVDMMKISDITSHPFTVVLTRKYFSEKRKQSEISLTTYVWQKFIWTEGLAKSGRQILKSYAFYFLSSMMLPSKMLKFASRYILLQPAPRYHRILGDTEGGGEKGETGREREIQMETERKRQRGIHRVEK